MKNTFFPKKNYQKQNKTQVKTTLIKRNCINGQAHAKDATKEGTYQIIAEGPKEIKTTKKPNKIHYSKNHIRLFFI